MAEIWGEIENWEGGYGYEGQSMSLPKWPTSQNSLAEALSGAIQVDVCSVHCTDIKTLSYLVETPY